MIARLLKRAGFILMALSTLIAGIFIIGETFTDLPAGVHPGHPGGQVHDWGVIAAPWGFRPQDITIEVDLWQGDQDDRVPRITAHTWPARYPAATSPCCAEKAT